MFPRRKKVGSGDEAANVDAYCSDNVDTKDINSIFPCTMITVRREIDAVAAAACGYQLRRPRPPLPEISQLERDLENIALGKSGSACIVAATSQGGLASSFISAVSLPAELLEDGFGKLEESNFGDYEKENFGKVAKDCFEDGNGWRMDGDIDNFKNHVSGNDGSQNFIIALKGGEDLDDNIKQFRKQGRFDDDIPSFDYDIKSLKSSTSKTNAEAIQIIIDLKLQLAQESSTKDELYMKLKQVIDEKSEIEDELAGMIREKLRLDELFKERTILKTMNQFQQQKAQQQDQKHPKATLKSGGRRNTRPTSNAVCSEFSNSLNNLSVPKRLAALVSGLENSNRDLTNHKPTENDAEAPPRQPYFGHKKSLLNSSLRSVHLRRSSSFFSGSFSALFSEAAVCPIDDNDQKPHSQDTIEDESKHNSFHSNAFTPSFNEASSVKPPSMATMTGNCADPANLSKHEIMSLIEDNIQLLRKNTNLSFEIHQLKMDLELLTNEFRKVLEYNNLFTTFTSNSSVSSNVKELLYNDIDDFGITGIVSSAVKYDRVGKKGVHSANVRGCRTRVRSCSVGSQKEQWKNPGIPLSQHCDRPGKDDIAFMRRLKNVNCDNVDDASSADSEPSNGEESISIGDDTIQNEISGVENKFSSFTSLIVESDKHLQSFLFGVDIIPEKQASPIVQHFHRPEFNRNNLLPCQAYSHQAPSCARRLSSRGRDLTRAKSFKVFPESMEGKGHNCIEYSMRSMDLYKQSSLRHLRVGVGDDTNGCDHDINETICDDDDS